MDYFYHLIIDMPITANVKAQFNKTLSPTFFIEPSSYRRILDNKLPLYYMIRSGEGFYKYKLDKYIYNELNIILKYDILSKHFSFLDFKNRVEHLEKTKEFKELFDKYCKVKSGIFKLVNVLIYKKKTIDSARLLIYKDVSKGHRVLLSFNKFLNDASGVKNEIKRLFSEDFELNVITPIYTFKKYFKNEEMKDNERVFIYLTFSIYTYFLILYCSEKIAEEMTISILRDIDEKYIIYTEFFKGIFVFFIHTHYEDVGMTKWKFFDNAIYRMDKNTIDRIKKIEYFIERFG
jgi:hypothetical protein